MKKSVILTIVLLVAAVSCSKEEQKDVAPKGPVDMSVSVVSPDYVKTAISGESVVWSVSGEYIKMLEVAGTSNTFYTSAEGVTPDGGATMSFSYTLEGVNGSDFNYYFLYPADSYVSGEVPTEIVAEIPSIQSPTASSYDPAADLLIGATTGLTSQPSALAVSLKRPVALACMSIEGLKNGETLQTITISATDGGTAVSLAGSTTYDLSTQTAGAVVSSATALTLDYTSSNITVEGTVDAWFVTYPFSLSDGDTFSVKIITSGSEYMKTISLTSAQPLAFVANQCSTFTVSDFAVVEASISTDCRSIYAGGSVTWKAAEVSGASYEWTFEGGTPSTSTEQNPTVTYSTKGKYDVTLKVTYAGKSDTQTLTDYAHVIPSDGMVIFLPFDAPGKGISKENEANDALLLKDYGPYSIGVERYEPTTVDEHCDWQEWAHPCDGENIGSSIFIPNKNSFLQADSVKIKEYLPSKSDLTVSMWVNLRNYQITRHFFSFGYTNSKFRAWARMNYGTGYTNGWRLGWQIVNSGGDKTNAALWNNAIADITVASTDISNDSWHHFAFVAYNDASGNRKVAYYLDGILSGTSTTTERETLEGDYVPFIIGGSWSDKCPLGGNIDDFIVYNRCLSAEEIAEIYTY